MFNSIKGLSVSETKTYSVWVIMIPKAQTSEEHRDREEEHNREEEIGQRRGVGHGGGIGQRGGAGHI